MQYRSRKDYSKVAKEEEIDAEQSKEILAVLAAADFNKPEPRLGMTALDLFYRLGVTQKDGWQPPQPKNLPVPLPVAPGGVVPPAAPVKPGEAGQGRAGCGKAPGQAPAQAPVVDSTPVKADDVPPPAPAKLVRPAIRPVIRPVPVKDGEAVPQPAAPPAIQIIGGGAAIGLPVRGNAEYIDSIKAWLKKNQETYRIKRFVEENK